MSTTCWSKGVSQPRKPTACCAFGRRELPRATTSFPARSLASARVGRNGAMDRQAELSIIRAAYAKQILAAAGIVGDARLEAAFGARRWEEFLGVVPW